MFVQSVFPPQHHPLLSLPFILLFLSFSFLSIYFLSFFALHIQISNLNSIITGFLSFCRYRVLSKSSWYASLCAA